jgi:hypothetical protein
MAHYAWTQMTTADGKKVNEGDTVTAASLGVSADEFKALEENGSISEEKYPDMQGFTGSPNELKALEYAIDTGQIEPEEAPIPKPSKIEK